MTTGERIHNRRKALDMTLEDVARLTDTSRQTVQRYESGAIQNIPAEKVEKLAQALRTTPAYLMGWEDAAPNITQFDEVHFASFKVIGSIAAGYGMEAVEEYTGEIEYLPHSMLHGRSPADFFVLKVRGNSMYPMFLDGDKVLVLRSTSVDSGSIAVVIYDSEATLKKVNYIYGEDWMELIPINPEYKMRRIENQDLESYRVLGKVVKLLRDV